MKEKLRLFLTVKKKAHINGSMEDKSSVQLLEDLIGILTNRQELLQKIIKKFPRAHDGNKTFSQYHKQTKKFLKALLAELSLYGDGTAGADHDNAYNDHWKAALTKWDTINHHRLIPFWRTLENILKNIYRKMLTLNAVLPASLQSILADQLNELENNNLPKVSLTKPD